MTKYFEFNDKKANKDLEDQVRVNIQHQNKYHMDYDTCTLTYICNKYKQQNFGIPAIICE